MRFLKSSLRLSGAALVAAGVLGGSLSAQAAPAPRYKIQDVGKMQGLISDNASAFNNSGEVTGTAFFRADPVQAYFSRNGNMRLLPSVPGNLPTQGYDINNHGDVVGAALTADGPRPFLWRNGNVVDLRPVLGLGQKPGSVNYINDAGQFAGYSENPFFYDGTRTHYLGVAGFTIGTPSDLSENGTVLLSGFDSGGALRSWLYKDGNYTSLPSPVDYVQFQAINDLGQAVGYTRDVQTPGAGDDLYLYSDGQTRRLEKYGGETTEITQAFNINNKGWIVGELNLNGDSNRRESFLYRDGEMQLFSDLVRPWQAKEWDWQFVYDINDAGQLLGFGGIGANIHSFVASPVPEPAHGLLMLLGLGWMGAHVRRRRGGA